MWQGNKRLYRLPPAIETEETPKNKRDFSLVLKVCREFDDVISAGKLFHVCACCGDGKRSVADSGPSR